MMFITHLSFALLIGLLIIKHLDISVNNYVFLAVILFASILPDADCADSFIGRKLKPLSLFLKHRGFFHSLSLVIILTIILFLISRNQYYALAFIIGFLSHLSLDSLTRAGVAPFWPSKLRFRGALRTGGVLDRVLFAIFLLLCVIYLIY